MALNEFEGTRDAGQPRPRAAARGVRRVLAGRSTAASQSSTATWTTTSAGCSRCRAPRARGGEPPARPGACRSRRPRRRRRPPQPRAPRRRQRPRSRAPSAATNASSRRSRARSWPTARGRCAWRSSRSMAGSKSSAPKRPRSRPRSWRARWPATTSPRLGRRLNHIAAETAMLEERWLELHAHDRERAERAGGCSSCGQLPAYRLCAIELLATFQVMPRSRTAQAARPRRVAAGSTTSCALRCIRRRWR